MNDNDVLDVVKDSMAEVRMGTPVEQIMAAGRSRRRRRVSGMVAGAVAVAAGMAAVLSIGGAGTTTTVATPPVTGTGPVHVRLAGYSVDSNPDGTATVVLHKPMRFDPGGLQRDLAQAGVPALVKVGQSCHGSYGPEGLDQVLRAQRLPDGSVIVIITPSAMPAGGMLFINLAPLGSSAKVRGAFSLVPAGAVLTCTRALPGQEPGRARHGS